jgi:hypothetical protein
MSASQGKRTASRRMRTGERTAGSIAIWGTKVEALYLGVRVGARWLFLIWQQGREGNTVIGRNVMLGWATEPRRAHVVHISEQFVDEGWRRM